MYKFNPFTGTLDNVSSGGGGGNSFTIWQPDHGTSPTASSSSDTMDVTSGDGSISITGNSSTKTLDFRTGTSRSDDRPPVAALDKANSSLPTGATVTIDGYVVANGDRILFTAVDNKVYVASGIGSSVVWTLATDGQAGTGTPTAGDTLWVINGTAWGTSRWTYTVGNVWLDGQFFEHLNVSSGAPSTGININGVPVITYVNSNGELLIQEGSANQMVIVMDGTRFLTGSNSGPVAPHFLVAPDAYADVGSPDGGVTLLRYRDLYLARNARIAGNLGVGNSVSATIPGTVVKKIEIFDEVGNSLGFIPVYNSIT